VTIIGFLFLCEVDFGNRSNSNRHRCSQTCTYDAN